MRGKIRFRKKRKAGASLLRICGGCLAVMLLQAAVCLPVPACTVKKNEKIFEAGAQEENVYFPETVDGTYYFETDPLTIYEPPDNASSTGSYGGSYSTFSSGSYGALSMPNMPNMPNLPDGSTMSGGVNIPQNAGAGTTQDSQFDEPEEEEEETDGVKKEPTIAEIDTFPENPCITWFVHGIKGRIEQTEVYVGADEAEVAWAGRLADGYVAPKTLILIDNSVSIGSKGNQQKIRSLLTRLIWNHLADEQFAIKTFAEESETIMDYTDNYDALRLALDKIKYKDQKTHLRNVLYQEIVDLLGDGELDYCRIIVISDGSDDSKLGITYEELTSMISADNGSCPIYTIGCLYKNSEKVLDKLFAISRLTGSPYFSLDEYKTPEDAMAIADTIRKDGNDITYFQFSLPPRLKDGSQKNVGLYVKTSREEYTLSRLMLLPRGTIQEMRQVAEERRAAQEKGETDSGENGIETTAGTETYTDTDTETETGDEVQPEEKKSLFDRVFDNKMFQVLLMPLILLGILLFVYFRGRRKDTDFHEISEPDETQVPVSEYPGAEAGVVSADMHSGERISLIDVERPQRIFHVKNGEEVVIGRTAARSDIAFPEDRLLSARHAMITMQNGRAVLDSLGHAEETSVKGNRVDSSVELFDGDIIRLGNTRLRVRYE